MKRALALMALACGACSLRAPRTTVPAAAPSCASNGQCPRSNICFLGECRTPASNLAQVIVEVRPPNDSPYAAQQFGGIDLQRSVVNNFTVQPAVAPSGTVRQAQDPSGSAPVPVANAVVTVTDPAPPMPDRLQQFSTRTDATGSYTMRVSQQIFALRVDPPAPLPPHRADNYNSTLAATAAGAADLLLPSPLSLARASGALTANGVPLGGAAVTAIDDLGAALSAPALSQADGGYSLLLPPGTSAYLLEVGPASDADGGTLASAADPLPTYDRLAPTSAGVNVSLPAVATLQGHVLDASGAAVPAALVYARSDGMPWMLLRSAAADANGFYSMTLRAGNYVVEAAPSAAPDAPAVSSEQAAAVTAVTSFDFHCPAKVRRFGQVLAPNGRPVGANYQIVATRLADRLLSARSATTFATDATGIYHLIADPGRYRFEIVPPADSGLPRKIVQMDLGGDPAEVAVPSIQISTPLSVVGTVTGSSSKTPVAGAMVNFFALDASGEHSVFLGGVLTDANGHYQTVLPDVSNPGAGP